MSHDFAFNNYFWEGFSSDSYQLEGEWLHIHLKPIENQALTWSQTDKTSAKL